MESARRITWLIISYTLSVAQSSFILMIFSINQLYLESQEFLFTVITSKQLKERFLIKKKKRKIVLGKKKKEVKQIHGEKNSSVAKFQNLIGKTILVCPGETFTDYVPNCIQICRRNTELPNQRGIVRGSSGVIFIL